MYLTDIIIKNIGPIRNLAVQMPFNSAGDPIPLIVVGQNGSGKSILLSSITDSLVEFAKVHYRDTVPNQGLVSPYFRVLGTTNQSSGANFSLSILKFSNKKDDFFLVEKTGTLEPAAVTHEIEERLGKKLNWPIEGNSKTNVIPNKDYLKDFFTRKAVCFFPPSRHERPHWLSPTGVIDTPVFDMDMKVNDVLGKPIVVESTAERNKQWILSVILDSLVNFEQNQETGHLTITDNINDKKVMKQARNNVEFLLRKVMRDDTISIGVAGRNTGANRVAIVRDRKLLVPSLDHLSSGQAILFNMFATIIRYADRGDVRKSADLKNIEGIVIIDEIDAHLHSDLQYELLAELIAVFPKVQFIVTSHAPLLLLGMERKFGTDGVGIVEMPSGIRITTERFSEFERSFEYYQKTKAYEDSLIRALQTNTKPLVLTEGETDPLYIRKSLEVLGRKDLLEAVEIEWVGAYRPGGAGPFYTGDSALNQTSEFIEANPDAVRHKKVLLLYDYDTNKPERTLGKLYIRKIPKDNRNDDVKGIENLLPAEVFGEESFHTKKERPSGTGRMNVIYELKKKDLCDWFCNNKNSKEDYIGFMPVINILENLLIDGNEVVSDT